MSAKLKAKPCTLEKPRHHATRRNQLINKGIALSYARLLVLLLLLENNDNIIVATVLR